MAWWEWVLAAWLMIAVGVAVVFAASLALAERRDSTRRQVDDAAEDARADEGWYDEAG